MRKDDGTGGTPGWADRTASASVTRVLADRAGHHRFPQGCWSKAMIEYKRVGGCSGPLVKRPTYSTDSRGLRIPPVENPLNDRYELAEVGGLLLEFPRAERKTLLNEIGISGG